MRSIASVLGLAVLMLQAWGARAEPPDGVQLSAKKQMVVCMNKSMAADKSRSYNDAQRDCKDRLLVRGHDATGRSALSANAAEGPALKTP